METPNPENIVVATRNFYLDPTHQRPIPSELLTFVAEHAGFARVKMLRLQESRELIKKVDLSLQDVFSGASPDYAVVAQKHAAADVVALTNTVFSREYGVSLEDLLRRWDGRLGRIEAKAQQAEAKAQQAEAKAQQAEAKAQQAEKASNERLSELQAVYASTSWKITKPLRFIKRLLVGDYAASGRSAAAVVLKVKQSLRPVLASSISYVFKHPPLRKVLSSALKAFPLLHARLLAIALNTGVVPRESPNATQMNLVPYGSWSHAMSPRTRQIYQDLKSAIDNKNQGDAGCA
jgi:O-antigen chain-terminating methyltransferase